MYIDFKNKRLVYRDGSWIKWVICGKKKVLFSDKAQLLNTANIVDHMEDRIDCIKRVLDDHKESHKDLQKALNDLYILPKFGRPGRLMISREYDRGIKRWVVIFEDNNEPHMIQIKEELMEG